MLLGCKARFMISCQSLNWTWDNLSKSVLSAAAHCDCDSPLSSSESPIGFSAFRGTNPNFPLKNLLHSEFLLEIVCVYLLKRSKTCTWSLGFPHEEHMIVFGKNLHHEEFFYLYLYSLYIYIYTSMRISSILLGCINFTKQGDWSWFTYPVQRSYGLINHLYLPSRWVHMVINKCLVGLLVFLFQAVGLHLPGTSSFMTSALGALVFVKVCNLWWVSDKVPQVWPGRRPRATPVQDNARLPDLNVEFTNFNW